MQINVAKQDTSVLVKNTTFSTQEHMTAKKFIQSAMNKQFNRCGKFNSSLSSYETVQLCPLSSTDQQFLDTAAKRLNLSARAYFKTLKVARTIADLDNSQNITKAHLAEALQFRQEI